MKQLSLLAGFLFCATAVLAQRPAETTQSMKPQPATEQEAAIAKKMGAEAKTQARGGGSILYQETFANGFDGSNGNGAWTVNDNQDGTLWIWVTPEGQGLYPGEVPTGSAHPGGNYSTNIGTLESTTAGDGWMIFDNDYWHGGPINANNPAFDTEGSLTSPWMDFTNDGSVIVSWESYFRYCCFPFAPIFLEVGSTVDGVTSWTTFDAHGNFIESANSASANPLPVSLDVSCVAAYQDSVQLRFAYRQAPETGNGYSHYYWGIDDVTVTSNNVANDLEITQVTNGNVFTVWEYRMTPFEQAIDGAADGGLVAGVMYKNAGTETQYGVDVLVEILDEDSMPIFSLTETIDTVYSYAQAPTCPANSQDTLYVQTGWEPAATGDYSLRITMILDSTAVDEATPLNNVLAKDFFYTEDIYGHDNEAALDTELGPSESEDIPGFYDPTGFGSYYHCPNPGSVAYGVAVKFGPNTGLNASGEVEPFEFTTRLYTLDGSATITDSPFDEAYWVFNTPPNPTGDPNLETYLAFDDPIDLGTWSSQTGGNFYFAGVMSEFESAAQLTVLAEPNSDTDNSTGVYSQTGAGDFVWFTSQTSTPGVRLITGSFEAGCIDEAACNYDASAGVSDASCLFEGEPCNDGLVNTFNDVVTEDCECEGTVAVNEVEAQLGLALLESMPNPATTNAVIQFELMQSKEVSLELRSLQGKLIVLEDFGALQAGLHRHDVDVTELAAGQYTYSLVVDGVKVTRKLTVN